MSRTVQYRKLFGCLSTCLISRVGSPFWSIYLLCLMWMISFSSSAIAQTIQWKEITDIGPITVSGTNSMAFDTIRNKIVLLGGNANNETWEYDGKNWQHIADSFPTPLEYTSMAFDENNRVTVLFGGTPLPSGGDMGDTWTWDGRFWTKVSQTGPSPRHSTGMAYDPIRKKVVLHGGISAGGLVLYDDTWEWDGVKWVEITGNRPSSRNDENLVFNAASGKIFLYASLENMTWVLNGNLWTAIDNIGISPSRAGGGMIYCPFNQMVIYFGGSYTDAIQKKYYSLNDTWGWDGNHWIQLTDIGPEPRTNIAKTMLYDPTVGRILLFGGAYVGGSFDNVVSSKYNDTWELDFGIPPTPTQPPKPIVTNTPVPPTATPPAPNATNTPVTPSGSSVGGGTVTGAAGTDVAVPINVKGLPNTDAISFDLTFDPNFLTYSDKLNTGMLSKWSMLQVNLTGNNVLSIGGLGDTVSGDGILINLIFKINASATNGKTSDLTISNIVGGGGLTALPVKVQVGGTRGDLNGDGSINILDVKLLFDAVMKKQLTDVMLSTCDFNKDGSINILDVKIMFDSVMKKQPLPAKVSARSVQPSGVSAIAIPTIEGTPGATVSVPINLTGDTVDTVQMDITYDSSKLEYKGYDKTGTIANSFAMFDAFESPVGTLSCMGFAASPVNANGVLINLQFTVKAAATGLAAIAITPNDSTLKGVTLTGGGINTGGQIASTPTITPTATTTPKPVAPTATPTVSTSTHNTIEIFDNKTDNSGDLTGKTDFDAVDNRNISININADKTGATDWHIYIRKGFGGVKYLGRTASGSKTRFDWYAKSPNTHADFINGPDFNSVYSFRVVRIDAQLGSDDFFDAAAPVGFNLEGGNSISVSLPPSPSIPANQVTICDDILGQENVAPNGSTGSDTDPSGWRALQIAWNFGVPVSSVNEYHVQISVDGGEFEFLGQTVSGSINYFWWTPNKEFKIADKFATGPQGGHTYQFRIFLLPFNGDLQSQTSGKVAYTVE